MLYAIHKKSLFNFFIQVLSLLISYKFVISMLQVTEDVSLNFFFIDYSMQYLFLYSLVLNYILHLSFSHITKCKAKVYFNSIYSKKGYVYSNILLRDTSFRYYRKAKAIFHFSTFSIWCENISITSKTFIQTEKNIFRPFTENKS